MARAPVAAAGAALSAEAEREVGSRALGPPGRGVKGRDGRRGRGGSSILQRSGVQGGQ